MSHSLGAPDHVTPNMVELYTRHGRAYAYAPMDVSICFGSNFA